MEAPSGWATYWVQTYPANLTHGSTPTTSSLRLRRNVCVEWHGATTLSKCEAMIGWLMSKFPELGKVRARLPHISLAYCRPESTRHGSEAGYGEPKSLKLAVRRV